MTRFDLTDENQRARAVAALEANDRRRLAALDMLARERGIPLDYVGADGRSRRLHGFRADGSPLYRITLNANAAISSAAAPLLASPYSLDGSGVRVGVWDSGSVRAAHQEFSGRVTLQNASASISNHATHVAGTIGASGLQPAAKGMAPAVSIDSYDWNSDYTEMTAAGAAAAGDVARIPLSNHSYGYESITSDMGRYEAEARQTDAICISLPFYLPCWAAGNEQDTLTALGGFQSITFNALAKNVLTVGAVNDAVSGGARNLAAATMSYFSSWGPADDGRIKPDLVANGVSVFSTVGTSNTAYDTYSGTSMATPSAAGSTALLVQLYAREFAGQRPRASLLKALLIHGADDLGTAGPDYKFGWGLINVQRTADILLAHKSAPSAPKMIEGTITGTQRTLAHTFTWDGASPIRATLVWTDPAGAAQSASDSRTPNLVHNLDLTLTAPNGAVYRPFVMPFVGAWTQASMAASATTGKNNVDNVEQVLIAAPTAAGTYTATVSLDGSLATSGQVYSLVVTGNTAPVDPAPTVTLTAPADGASLTLGGSVTLTATASDLNSDGSAGTIASVEFFAGSTSLGTDASAPYSLAWTPPAVGTYSLTAQAVDGAGKRGTSAPVGLQVAAGPGTPTVTISSPGEGSALLPGQPVTITASASVPNSTGTAGTITSVEFFAGATSLGVDTTAPFSATWTPAAPGAVPLTARATSGAGIAATSAEVGVYVLAGDGKPTVATLAPSTGPVASIVTITGVNFYQVTSVRFNGVAASFVATSTTSLNATVPAGAGTGPLTVSNAQGVSDGSAVFTVLDAPVVISQIYASGGLAGAPFNADYVELYNRSAQTVPVSGWSLQSATATGSTWQTVLLNGTIAPGAYHLVRLATGAVGASLPAADSTGTADLAATGGKLALRNTSAAFTGSTLVAQAGLQDLVGYGTANASETATAAAPSLTTAIFRRGNGATDTGSNASDFFSSPPSPRNSAGANSVPIVVSATSASGVAGTAFTYQIVAANFPTSFNASPLPAGLSVDTATGIISGVPETASTTGIQLSASNASGTGTTTLLLIVAPAPVAILSENAGSPAATTSIAANIFQNPTLGFSGSADIRNIPPSGTYSGASGGGHVFFTNTSGVYFEISGINATGHTGLSLAFGHYKSTTAGGTELIVEVSSNGITYSPLSYSRASGAGTANWTRVSTTGAIPVTSNLRIRFRQTSATTQFRVDDIVLSGTPAGLPSISLVGSPAALTSTYGTASAPTTVTLAGSALGGPLQVAAPAGFEISQSDGGVSGYAQTQSVGSVGTLAPTTIYVRLAASSPAGGYVGDISASGGGASTRTLSLPAAQVTRAPLIITARDRTKRFGESLALGTAAFTAGGLAGDETVGAVTLVASGGTGANDTIGSYLITPSAATGGTFNAANYTLSYQTGTLTVTGLDFGAWIGARFSGAAASFDSDPDGDGLPNLLEFFLGLDPETADAANAPLMIERSGAEVLYTYRRSKAQAQYAGFVEWTSALDAAPAWSRTTVVDEFVADAGAYEVRRARVPFPADATRRFVRLRVEPAP